MLQQYLGYFETAEINSTFYALPKPKFIRHLVTLDENIFFTAKIPKKVTHDTRLDLKGEGGTILTEFFRLLEPLHGRIPVLLIQLPPWDISTMADLEAFLSQVIQAHRLQVQELAVNLTLEPPPSLPLVEADRDRLAQVMGNLLSNALRYIPQGGHIVVHAAVQEHEVTVSVTDDGPGVPSEDIPYLFERFWRSDQARRRDMGGSGLGLTIARSLVEAHGGHIWAESIEGTGSTFTFTLPVASES